MKGKMFRKIKRGIAALLSSAMVLSGLPAAGGIVSYAGELQENTYLSSQPVGADGQYIGTDSAALAYGSAGSHSGTNQFGAHHSFNISAIKRDEDANLPNKGYNTDLKTSFSNNWFGTYYAFGKPNMVGPIVSENTPAGEILENGGTVDPKNIQYAADKVNVSSAQAPAIGKREFNTAGKLNGQVSTISIPGGGEMEVRTEFKPSADKQWIILEYTVYNGSDHETHFNIGHETDTQLVENDSCPIIVTEQDGDAGNPDQFEGLHMIARETRTSLGLQYKFTNFDIVTYHPDPDLAFGVTKRPTNDKSETRVWVGRWSTTGGVYHNNWAFSKSPESIQGGKENQNDSAAAFSAYMHLMPYETKTVRFGLSMKPSVYYVKARATGGDGFILNPCGSVEEAVAKIKANGAPKAYIFLMSDVEIGNTIEIPENTSITIQTTDFQMLPNVTYDTSQTRYAYRNPPKPYPTNDPRMVVKRAAGFNGDLFKVASATSSFTIGDVTIDGGSSSSSTGSLVNAAAGTVRLRKGSILQNNIINYDNPGSPDASTNLDRASAVEIGSGEFEMNFGTIRDNKSIRGSAVNFNGGRFELNNTVLIKDNKDRTDAPANVKLGAGKEISVGENIGGSSQIGVSVVDPPSTPSGKRTIARPKDPAATVYPYSAANFSPDRTGNMIALDNTAAEIENVILTSAAYSYTVRHVNAINQATLAPPVLVQKTVGTSITENPLHSLAGYAPVGVDLSAGSGLSADPGSHIVTGNMPSTDVIVTFKYSKSVAVSHFDTKGGNPLPSLTEIATGGASTLAMPTPSRSGYQFTGWNKFTDGSPSNKIFNPAEGDTDLGPAAALDGHEGEHFYYAKWTPGGTLYDINVIHRSSGSRLSKNLATQADQKAVEQRFDAEPLLIPGNLRGYQLNTLANNDSPAQEAWPGTIKFDPLNGYKYSIKMKPQSFIVNYRYDVDPSQTFHYKVIHKRVTGEIISEVTLPKITEQMITAAPLSLTDWQCSNAEITQGKTGTLDDPLNPNRISGTDDYKTLSTDPDFEPDKSFRSFMPNQDVTIVYTYAPEGDYFVNAVYKDATDQKVLKRESEPKAVLAAFTKPNPNLYGYQVNHLNSTDTPHAGTFNADGSYSGTMPNSNLLLNYSMDRDPALWSTITFAIGNAPNHNGTLGGATAGSFLRDDGVTPGRNPDSFAKIGERGLIPTPIPNDPPYYRFSGWFMDPECTIPVADTAVFTGDVTVYAKFDEDPAYWIDIHFASGPNGSISFTGPLHTKKDHTWLDIAALRPVPVVPNTTPNYEFDRWTVDSVPVKDATVLVNGATYLANFKKVASVWGLNMGDFNPSGHVGMDGSGEIAVRETQAGNVYIVSDLAGNIVAVMTSPADGSIRFTDLFPGTRYHVQEGTPDTVALVGQPIGSISASIVSAPKEVLIPTVEDNYNVGFDPDNEDRAQIVINPADPDSDYALIDEEGNIVEYPSSDHGWMQSLGSNPSTVTFNNLNPGETYRVVARKKGDAGVPSPLDKYNEGNDINANPGDMVDAKKFIVETLGDPSAVVSTVNGNAIGLSKFEEAKEGDEVAISTAAVNASGQPFKYWKVIAGRSRGVSGRITSTDFSFKMSSSNIVFRAVYERAATIPSNANSEEEIRGGAQGEFALEPDGIPALEDELTTEADEVLMDINGAEVSYRIVFNKRNARSDEQNAVKPLSIAGSDHPTAFSAAWGLDIFAERYVDGRLVGRATPSNAMTDVIIQLPNEDTDMLDYELFDVTGLKAPAAYDPIQVTMSVNPEDTAGLFRFRGKIGHSYVLVYSKTFKLRFIDNNPVMDHLHLNDVSRNFYHVMKIRRKEAPTDVWYDTAQLWRAARDYRDSLLSGRTTRPTAKEGIFWEANFADIYGVEYSFVDWSKKNMPAGIAIFDPDAAVTKTSPIFAYYINNREEVAQARTSLDDLVARGDILMGDPYITDEEIDQLGTALRKARARLDQKRGELLKYDFGQGLIDPQRMAIYEELRAAIDELSRLIREIGDNIAKRKDRFNAHTGGSSGGGSGSPGRGSGSKNRPFENTGERTFTLGVDGAWEINKATKKWSFVLNGGLPLNNTWGKIQFADASGKLITKWYFFDQQSSMIEGWYHDKKLDKWYFLNDKKGADNGQMLIGWFFDQATGKWYYLDPVVGEMYTGWCRIGEKWYYFSTIATENHPRGSLYISTTTPDGYRVNHDGEWIQ